MVRFHRGVRCEGMYSIIAQHAQSEQIRKVASSLTMTVVMSKTRKKMRLNTAPGPKQYMCARFPRHER